MMTMEPVQTGDITTKGERIITPLLNMMTMEPVQAGDITTKGERIITPLLNMMTMETCTDWRHNNKR